jgi:hypothetical protein
MPRLISKCGDIGETYFDLRLGTNRVGRVAGNSFQIDHPTVSSKHCEIIWLDDGVIRVRDLDSTNGTFIEGKQIQQGEINSGQTLRLGEVEFVLDSSSVQISVPKQEVPAQHPAPLANGAPACQNHFDVPAAARCTKCKREYCTACIHELHRIGGKLLKLCPNCSGAMEPLPNLAPPPEKKKSLFARLRNTLKMERKG